MAKTSSTVHLEDSTWEEIKEYQDKYGCSRNEAIERMFVERRVLMNLNYNSNKNNDTKIVEIDKEELAAAVDSAYDDMPE
ncbi:hypothetical protein [Fusobacterium varium]